MADLISKSDRFAYVRVAVPIELFDRLVSEAGSVNRALAGLRLEWQRVLAVVRIERVN